MLNKLSPLKLGDLEIKIPIIQGGMGVKISTASLVSAVAECGGAGTIASVGLGSKAGVREKDYLESSRAGLIREVRDVRSRTKGVFGVNILSALNNFEDLARCSAAEKVDYIISGAGLPLRLPEFVEGSEVKLIPVVSSGRVAKIITNSWKKKYNKIPDAIVVEGPLAGGHLGFSFDEIIAKKENVLESLVQDVLEVVEDAKTRWGQDIPIIAAGGIFDGQDIAKFLKLGAKGVQMGTRFVATYECAVPQSFKQKYLDAKDDDIVLIKSPVGLPGRAISTEFTKKLMNDPREKIICNYRCLKTCDAQKAPYCIARMLLNAVDEDLIEDSVVFAGRNVTKIDEIVSVKELMDTLVSETIQAC